MYMTYKFLFATQMNLILPGIHTAKLYPPSPQIHVQYVLFDFILEWFEEYLIQMGSIRSMSKKN